MKRGRRWLSLAVVAAVAASAGGVVASTWVRSPADVAAATAPPPPTLLTAEVVRRELKSTIIVRGTGVSGRRVSFTVAASAASESGPAATRLVVTRRPVTVGSRVRAGQVALEVSQRPVFVLPGKVGMFRDLLPGVSGRDVGQLQAALGALGYGSADRPGFFGASTALAVKRFYAERGYPAAYAEAAFGDPEAFSGHAAEAISVGDHVVAVPMSEVMFLPRVPARLVAVGGRRGQELRGAALTMATGDVTLVARLPPDQASLVRKGMAARVLDEAAGFTGRGVVSGLGSRRRDASGDYVPVTITRAGGWPQAVVGGDLRITVTAAATDGAVLVVPVAAITSRADGQALVTVVAQDGSRRAVPVAAGASADGWVQVDPVTVGDLGEGDAVVTGR